MIFRANEEEEKGYQRALDKLVGTSIEASAREKSKSTLNTLIQKYGPVVEGYPWWHPFVILQSDSEAPVMLPSERCEYRGIDHAVYLRNAFITCPYSSHDIEESVKKIKNNERLDGIAQIDIEKIKAQLYHPNAQPMLVTCEWSSRMEGDGTIPRSIATGLILERVIPKWRDSRYTETWETMRPYLLGQPSGSRSSLFVNQETGQSIKLLWNTLIKSGMFGPIHKYTRA